MKKIILAVAFVALTATAATAQTNQDAREKARQERVATSVEQMKAALATQNFSFIPNQMDMAFRGTIFLNTLSFAPYFDVLPSSISINLPYSWQNNPPVSRIYDLYAPSVQPYTYKVKAGEGNTYFVTISLTNISNQNTTFMPLQTQNFNLGVHFTINAASGFATMTLTPDFASPITYTGAVVAGN